MSGTRRTPLERRSAVQITPRALELFGELERSRRARKHAVDCTISEQDLCTGDCRVCQQWWDLHNELHIELRLQPWQWPCIPRNPYPPGSPGAREWRPGTEQQELRDLLNEARQEAARRRAAASAREKEDTYADPVAGEETLS
jgi:hypothetical protein